MKFIQTKYQGIYVLSLKRGDDLLEEVENFCEREEIKSGAIVAGIGAFLKCLLGYFDIVNRKYLTNKITEPVELVNCSGTISTSENKIIPHIHVSIAKTSGECFGGHLQKGSIISVTGEIIIVKFTDRLHRTLDEETGLLLLEP